MEINSLQKGIELNSKITECEAKVKMVQNLKEIKLKCFGGFLDCPGALIDDIKNKIYGYYVDRLEVLREEFKQL